MVTQTITEAALKIVTPETLRYAAKQSKGCLTVPVRLRRAIKKYLKEQEAPHMKKKVLQLSQSFNEVKYVNQQLTTAVSRELVEDPLKSVDRSKRWKIKSSYGDIGLMYRDNETTAYVASRMPAVYSACYRVLKEVCRRLPGFSPAKVLDFGAGTGSAFWALREIWPKSLERVNLIEPSQSMQRAGQSLMQGLKNLPLIHGYGSLQELSKSVGKSERKHDLVIAIPSRKDRITIVRQLWDLTDDILVLVEPGTPHGSNIINQMRSYILWMEKRKYRKCTGVTNGACKDLVDPKSGAFIVAPCPHDGPCPLAQTEKYCHFVQRLERTSSQRAYKRSKGVPLRGFEDEKFSYVAFRRGQRPSEPWPLDGIKFDTLKEQRAKRNREDLEGDNEDPLELQEEEEEGEEALIYPLELQEEEEEEEEEEAENAPDEEADPVSYDSDVIQVENDEDDDEDEKKEGETAGADLGGGWGRIIFMPVRRGRQVAMNVCRSTKRDGSEGSYERIVVTKNKNPTLHYQAKRSMWGDLWPF